MQLRKSMLQHDFAVFGGGAGAGAPNAATKAPSIVASIGTLERKVTPTFNKLKSPRHPCE
jgi:ribose 5-phosphate isomerase RpiB